jgi:long-chain acyl-CoA synthetase
VLSHSGAKVLIAENDAQVAKVRGLELDHIIVMVGEAEGAITMAQLRAKSTGDVTGERLAAIGPDDIATIVYTSGTTGPPKGCALTHANLLFTVDAYIERLKLRESPPTIYNYLPFAHVLARMVEFVTIDTGGVLAFWSGDSKKIAADIAEINPTHIPTVPRLLEKIYTRVLTSAKGMQGQILLRALATAGKVAAARRAGRRPNPLDAARHAVGDRVVLSKIRAAMGTNNPVVLVGAAPIGRDVLEFFDSIGVPVLEGYGMTETCAASTLNTVEEMRLGSVGRPLPGVEVKTADDEELLMRGPLVFPGYYRNDDATKSVIDDEGWMHSGDLGRIEDGYVFITGRKKDLVITSSGKNISPELIESALRDSRWISQAVVVGDRRSYLTALVTLDPDEAPKLASELEVPNDLASMSKAEQVRQVVWRDIEAANRRFARIEQVKRFAILPRDLSQEDGELTPTLKVKRAAVYDKYAETIDELYGETT